MPLFAPPYYRDFQCISHRCRHSCCVDWEIGIDEDAYQKYETLPDILATVEMGEEGPSFRLCPDGRCPHLNAQGLCTIILTHGEGCLAEICRQHPRFYNHLPGGRVEVGLGLVCEEACRLILTDDRPFTLLPMGEAEGEVWPGDFDPQSQRDRVLDILASADYDRAVAALREVFALPAVLAPARWHARFLSLEMLDPAWEQDLRSVRDTFLQGSGTAFEVYYRRLLTYFLYRHGSVAKSTADFRARLGFCILSVEAIRSLFEARGSGELANLMDWARRYSAEIEYSEDNTAELIFAFAAE